MIAKAWQLAKQQKQIGTNPIRGEEKICITITESFALAGPLWCSHFFCLAIST